jgi:hypothetical protein
MNQIVLIVILLSFINVFNFVSAINNYGLRIRNSSLRLLLFKDRNNIKLFKQFKKFYEMCYNKSISSIGKGVSDYNTNLSEDDRIIIETIISLCY